MRIVGIIFIVVYLLIGFYLFAAAIHRLGGIRRAVSKYYKKNVFKFLLSGLTVLTAWPVWYLIAKISREKEIEEQKKRDIEKFKKLKELNDLRFGRRRNE